MRKIIAVPECKIGLLGGSFNPPHIGHLHISLKALKKFKLSKIIEVKFARRTINFNLTPTQSNTTHEQT